MYDEEILDHNAHPLHKDCAISGNYKKQLVNASCGDNITLELEIVNDTVVAGSFGGAGCAISQASTDMMLDSIIGKNIKQIDYLQKLFIDLIHSGKTHSELGELNAFENVSKMPARTKCALLPWQINDINH